MTYTTINKFLALTTVFLLTAGVSCVDFSTVPECLEMNTDLDKSSQSYTQNIDEYNADQKARDSSYTPFTYPGYTTAYYVQLMAMQGATKECKFIVDKSSAVFYIDLQAALSQTGVITAKVYSVSGPTCETVASTGTDIVTFQQYFPYGGVNKDKCAYLFHFKIVETSGGSVSYAIQNFIVYYTFTSKPYATSAASHLMLSMYSSFAMVFAMLVLQMQ
eukprot:403358899